jgi:DNA mismatch repair protein MutS2
MFYPDNFESKIGFDKIRNLIKSECIAAPAKSIVDDIVFSTDIGYIRKSLALTNEMMSICLLKDNYPANNYPDVSQAASRMRVEGTCLQLFELADIRTVLENCRALRSFFRTDDKNEFPNLKQIVDSVNFPTYLYDRLQSVLTKNGTMKDTASPELREIRISLISTQESVSRKLNSILSSFREQGWVSKDLSATMVNGRLVLPIETTYKRKVQGFVHDESASGKTSYIEPQEVLEMNNRIRELELSEAREIQKILYDLTCEFRPYADDLKNISQVIAELDFIRAKAKFAIQIEAIIPSVHDEPCLDIVRGKHPLLYLTLKKENREIVPTTFRLDSENRILLISGPNAGGKSVCLKTAAILSYMLQCGLPVPVGGASSFGIFSEIMLDIGDEQSIENDLSTYSSHLVNMKHFLKNAGPRTLLFIDEFGSGTDPIIGGTIAEAILEQLNASKTFGMITTHYTNLKVFAAESEGIINGAMLIDHTNMQPTFILEVGIPGSSYAVEIARRIGLPEAIISKVVEKTGTQQMNIDRFLRELMRDKRYWERKRKQVNEQSKKVDEALRKNLEELEIIKTKRKQIIENARSEAEQLLNGVNKQIENTISEIKRSNADKDKTREVREEIKQFKEDFEKSKEVDDNEFARKYEYVKRKIEEREARKKAREDAKKLEIIPIDEDKINIGSKVRLAGQEAIGDVTGLSDKTAVVCFGSLYMSVALDRLQKVSQEDYANQRKQSSASALYSEKALNFKPYIDVRGDRTDEALRKIEELVDAAVMLSHHELKILHGRGNGILRQNIRQYLKTIPQVKSIADEDIRFGGDGITVVKLD